MTQLPSPAFRNVSLSGTLSGGTATETEVSATTALSALAGSAGGLRSLAARFSDQLNVLDFQNAPGQGTQIGAGGPDDAALGALLSAASGRAIAYIPAGLTLNVNGPIVIPSNTHLILDGTIKLLPHAGTTNSVVILGDGADNILVEGIGTIDGNYTQQTGGGFSAALDSQLTVSNTGSSRVIIRGIECINATNMAVNVIKCKNGLVESVSGTGHNSFEMVQCNNVAFRRCVSSIIGAADGAISIYGGNQDCTVEECLAIGGVSGIIIYNDDSQPLPNHNCQIVNNKVLITGAGTVYQYAWGVQTGGNVANLPNIGNSIIGNLCLDDGTVTSLIGAYIVGNASDTIVSGNISRYTGALPKYQYAGVHAFPLVNLLVSSNLFCPPAFNGTPESTFFFFHDAVGSDTSSMVVIESNVCYNDTAVEVAAYSITNFGTTAWLSLRNNSFSENVNGISPMPVQFATVEGYLAGGTNGGTGPKMIGPGIVSPSLMLGSVAAPTGPTILSRATNPQGALTAAAGSICIWTAGTVSQRVFVSQGGTTWLPITGV